MRIDWKTPKEELFLVTQGKYIAYAPRLKQAYKGSVSMSTIQAKSGGMFYFLNMSKAQLSANFSMQYLGDEKIIEGKIPAWHLRFIPKTASGYKNADIWADVNGMIRQIKIVPKSGDEIYLKLYNLKENIRLSTKQFKWRAPKGVKVISS